MTSDLQLASDTCKNLLSKLLEKVKARRVTLSEYDMFLSDYIKYVEDLAEKVRSDVVNQANKLHSLIDQIKERTIMDIDGSTKTEVDNVTQKKTEMGSTLQGYDCVHYIEELLNHGQREEVLIGRQLISRRLNNLIRTNIQPLTNRLTMYFVPSNGHGNLVQSIERVDLTSNRNMEVSGSQTNFNASNNSSKTVSDSEEKLASKDMDAESTTAAQPGDNMENVEETIHPGDGNMKTPDTAKDDITTKSGLENNSATSIASKDDANFTSGSPISTISHANFAPNYTKLNLIPSNGPQDSSTLLGKLSIYNSAITKEAMAKITNIDINFNAIQPMVVDDPKLVLEFTCYGSNDSKDLWPSGLAITHENDIVILDRENQVVKIFDEDAVFLREIRSTPQCELGCPFDVTILDEMSLALTDHDNESVQIFTLRGDHVKTFQGSLNYPRGIETNKNGDILVVDSNNRCLTIHDKNNGKVKQTINGRDRTEHGVFTDPYYVTVTKDDRIIVTDWAEPHLHIFDSNGRYLNEYGSYGLRANQMLEPYGVCTDSYGYIFVADHHNNRIHMLSPDGVFIRYLLTENDGLWRPMTLAIDHKGHLVVAQALGTVKVYKYI